MTILFSKNLVSLLGWPDDLKQKGFATLRLDPIGALDTSQDLPESSSPERWVPPRAGQTDVAIVSQFSQCADKAWQSLYTVLLAGKCAFSLPAFVRLVCTSIESVTGALWLANGPRLRIARRCAQSTAESTANSTARQFRFLEWKGSALSSEQQTAHDFSRALV